MNLDRLTQELSLIGQLCYYKLPDKDYISSDRICEITSKVNKNGQVTYCHLSCGIVAVLYIDGCPEALFGRVQGFLSEEKCKEHWNI